MAKTGCCSNVQEQRIQNAVPIQSTSEVSVQQPWNISPVWRTGTLWAVVSSARCSRMPCEGISGQTWLPRVHLSAERRGHHMADQRHAHQVDGSMWVLDLAPGPWFVLPGLKSHSKPWRVCGWTCGAQKSFWRQGHHISPCFQKVGVSPVSMDPSIHEWGFQNGIPWI